MRWEKNCCKMTTTDALDFADIRRELVDAAAMFRADPDRMPLRRADGTFTVPALCGPVEPTEEMQKMVMRRWHRVEELIEEWRWCDYVHARSPHTIRLLQYKDDALAFAPHNWWGPQKVEWLGKENEVADVLSTVLSQPRYNDTPTRVLLVKSMREAYAQADRAWAYLKGETN